MYHVRTDGMGLVEENQVCGQTPYTGPVNNTCTWLRECCRQTEGEVVSNSRNQLHQTTYKYYFRAQYIILDSGGRR